MPTETHCSSTRNFKGEIWTAKKSRPDTPALKYVPSTTSPRARDTGRSGIGPLWFMGGNACDRDTRDRGVVSFSIGGNLIWSIVAHENARKRQ
jgi:hypothetical protein